MAIVSFKKMLYRVKKNTFIRIYGEISYICNIVSKKDLVYDSIGGVFLTALSKEAKDYKVILQEVYGKFVGANIQTIDSDLRTFLSSLQEQGFIISGEDLESLDKKETIATTVDREANLAQVNSVPLIKKTANKTQDFLRTYFRKDPHLVSVQIEVSNKCNERCIHCYIPHELKVTNIDENLFESILRQCQELGVLTLVLTGGEPMIHPNFVKFLKKLSKFDFEVKVLSNLTYLNDDIIKALKSTTCSGVQASLYSMQPEVHDAITGKKGSFEQTVASIKRLHQEGIPVQVSCVVMKKNKDSFEDVINWASSLGITVTLDYILMGRYDGTTSNLEQRLSISEVEEIIKNVIKNNEAYRNEILSADINSLTQGINEDNAICNVCRSTIGISANGRVYPCVGWQGNVIGDLRETSLEEIWLSSPKVCELRNLSKKDFPKCKDCDCKAFCSMCLVRNANENDGDYLKISEHTCDVARLNKRVVMNYRTACGH